MSDGTLQYGRVFSLVVSNSALNGVDLSELRCKFVVKRSDTLTPNVADIRVFNVTKELALQISREYKKVTLQAGYEGNFGVIFQGNIKQVIIGRESGTDTFVDIIAGDGDFAYNFAVVNASLAAGSTLQDQAQVAVASMAPKGVTQGFQGDFPSESLPRGKVLYGNARNYLKVVAETSDKTVSIQDEKVVYISKTSYLPGEAVLLSDATGLIGTPQQTNEGLNVKSLLNPMIKIGGRVKIDSRVVIERQKINFSVPGSPSNIPMPLSTDGVYYVMVVEYQGDTRGTEWYSSMLCLSTDISANPANAITAGGGLF